MKRKTIFRLLAALLGATLTACAFVSCDAKTDEGADKQQANAEIKIMTFNVLNGWNTTNIGTRDDETAEKILELMPDVIGLQEFDDYYRNATGTPLSALISAQYAEAGSETMSWNPIFYNTSTVELIQCGHENYTLGTSYDTYNYKGQIGSKFRTIDWALLKHKDSDKQFLVLNTHLDVEADKQPSQVSELKNKVTELKKSLGAEAIFLIGDLNSNVNSATAKNLFQFGFKDTHELAQTKDDLTSCGTKGAAVTGAYQWAIDHVYCIGEQISVSNYLTVTDIRNASDHCPVAVTLRLD